MTHPEVVRRVQQVADRVRLVRRRFALSLAGLMAAALGLGCLGLARWFPASTTVWQFVFAGGSAALLIGAFAASRRRFADLTLALHGIEKAFPDLQARLLTAVEQQPDVWTGKYNVFQSRLLTEVGGHARAHDWTEIIPKKMVSYANRRQWVALATLCVVAWMIVRLPSSAERNSSLASMGREAARGGRSDYSIDPGDVQVERNQSLLVLIRFQNTPPRDVQLEWHPDGGAAQRLSMTKSLDDPVFAGRLATIAGNGSYRLEFDGVTTPGYSVTVYDLPALVHSSLTVFAPDYTRREPQVFASAAAATVIEGSQVRLACRVNKPLARVELRNEVDDAVVPLAVDPADPLTYAALWSPDKSRKWLLALIDGDGRTNRDPLEFQIDVIPNRRPDFKPVFPGQDLRVSALQELPLETRVSDDFGILSSGVIIDPAGREPVNVPLAGELAGGEAHALTHLLSLESFPLEPGEIVSYAFFAEDHGPDGKPRRTMGDLFFLEIRPFDESFREMEGAGGKSNMQGASSSPSQNLDKLIELQKQIVTAAWNLARRDPDLSRPDEQAAVETLRASQESAHEQFEQLSQNLAEAVPAERIRTIFEQMSRAVEEFTAAGATQKLAHLDGAAQAARGAFQGLVRLRPTDHRIMKGGQSGGGGGSTSQQQLEELELSGEQNRYESEKSARNPTETSQQKENLAFLNRLKELAQRQQGLNEKLKELDAELRTAQSEDERRELERQLKQLRDEQQDQLQDADALRNKLEQAKNSEQTADARRQLEQTRQQLVDAAESLKEGKLGQALSSGTRAERDLQKLQDDFRKKSSAQLAEALQQLKTQAKELTEAEEQASQELAGLNDKQEKSLRQRQQREKLAEKFQEQRARLEAALKSVRETVEAAEATEPLAAKRLYEAARQAQQQKTEQALNAAEQLVRQGFLPEATQVEQIARTGLQTLRDGIEDAAESVLGDELADLKRAKRELAELSQQLQQEMAASNGGDQQTAAADSQDADGSQESAATEGEKAGAAAGESNPTTETPAESESPSPNESPGGEGTSPSAGKGKSGLRGGTRRKPNGQASQPGQGTQQPGQSDGGQGGGPGGQGGPLTGGNYSEFVDRLRDVETLLNDPELQTEVARVREQARGIRADFKRHSKLPNWEVVEEDVRQPLVELQRRLSEEIARRESPDALVPTDRDPVPQRYRELVRKYYERLGGGGK